MSREPTPFPLIDPQLMRVLTGITTLILTTCGVVFYRMTIDKAWYEARGDITLHNLSHMLMAAAAAMLLMFGLELFVRLRSGRVMSSLRLHVLPLLGMALGFGLAWALSGKTPFWWA